MSKDPFQTRSTGGSTDLSRQGSAVCKKPLRSIATALAAGLLIARLAR
ncbi:hypothetical protein [Delftia tsuruhatensis]|nr:hypothetical protein [Delftia tsuruhatensis]